MGSRSLRKLISVYSSFLQYWLSEGLQGFLEGGVWSVAAKYRHGFLGCVHRPMGVRVRYGVRETHPVRGCAHVCF